MDSNQTKVKLNSLLSVLSIVPNLFWILYNFDNRMSLNEYIAKICKSSQYHLRNIGKIRKLLDQNTTEIFLHASVSISGYLYYYYYN